MYLKGKNKPETYKTFKEMFTELTKKYPEATKFFASNNYVLDYNAENGLNTTPFEVKELDYENDPKFTPKEEAIVKGTPFLVGDGESEISEGSEKDKDMTFRISGGGTRVLPGKGSAMEGTSETETLSSSSSTATEKKKSTGNAEKAKETPRPRPGKETEKPKEKPDRKKEQADKEKAKEKAKEKSREQKKEKEKEKAKEKEKEKEKNKEKDKDKDKDEISEEDKGKDSPEEKLPEGAEKEAEKDGGAAGEGPEPETDETKEKTPEGDESEIPKGGDGEEPAPLDTIPVFPMPVPTGSGGRGLPLIPSGLPPRGNAGRGRGAMPQGPRRRRQVPFISHVIEEKEYVEVPNQLYVVPETKREQKAPITLEAFKLAIDSRNSETKVGPGVKRTEKTIKWIENRDSKSKQKVMALTSTDSQYRVDDLIKNMPKFDSHLAYAQYLGGVSRSAKVKKERESYERRYKETGNKEITLKWLRRLSPLEDAETIDERTFEELTEAGMSPVYFEICDMMPGINTGTYEQRMCVMLNHFKPRKDKMVYRPVLGNATVRVSLGEDVIDGQYHALRASLASENKPVPDLKVKIMTVIQNLLADGDTLSEDFITKYRQETLKLITDINKKKSMTEAECISIINKPGRAYCAPKVLVELIAQSFVPWYTPVWEVLLWASRDKTEIEIKLNGFILGIVKSIRDDVRYGKEHVKKDISAIRSRGLRPAPVAGALTRFLRQICSDLRKIAASEEQPRYLYVESPFKEKKEGKKGKKNAATVGEGEESR